MKISFNAISIAILFMFFTESCTKDTAILQPDSNTNANPAIFQSPPPDTSFRPIVMIHGLLASGDTYTSFAQRFTSNGYKWSKIYAYDWNTLAQGANDVLNLDKFIDQVRLSSGYAQVELIGHSAGGGLGYNYLKDASRAAKVAHYVHIGSSAQAGPAGPSANIPTLNIWSDGDKIVQGADIKGAINVKLIALDHYQVATSAASFEAAYQFFKDEKPKTTEISWENTPCIGGRVLTFGENQPAAAATVKVFEVNSVSGERISDTPIYETITDANGNWSPVIIKPAVNYELEVRETGAGKRALHYYREGFIHNNLLVYLRTIPPPTSLAGLLLSGLPNNSEQSVLNVFSSSQAIINGRDSLIVDNNILSTASIAPASKTMIALFLYDNNRNNKSDFTPITLYASLSFLNGIDQFFDTKKVGPIEVLMNKRKLAVQRWKASEDIVVAVFD
ncbi:MAG: alpha/beta fold hydrolase [Saprospiraceae bacterium]